MIKKLIILLSIFFAAPTVAQQIIYCNSVSLVPCDTISNKGTGAQGDPFWLAFGKINANITTLFAGGGFGPCPPFTVLANTTSSSAAPICVNSLQILSVVAPTGGTISATGSGVVNANQINGTTVPINSSSDQALTTNASATGQWTTLPGCLDAAGNHLNYNSSTHAFSCGNTGGAAGSVAFGNITGAPTTNTNATMTCGTGCTMNTSGSGTMTANSLAASTSLSGGVGLPLTTGVSGLLPIANGGTGTASPGSVAGANIQITGTWPNEHFAATNSAATAFSSLTTSDNTSCAPCRIGTGATLSPTGSGTITANSLADTAYVVNSASANNISFLPLASSGNFSVMTGAGPPTGIVHLNDANGTGATNVGNINSGTSITGAPVNLNPGTVAGNVTILNGTSASGLVAIASGTTPSSIVSIGRTTSGNINIGDTTATGTINIGNTGTTTVMQGPLTQSGGLVTVNNASASDVKVLTGASTGILHLNDGTGSGNSNLGNANSGTIIIGAPLNLNPGGSSSNVTILNGTSPSGNFNVMSGTTATGNITIGTNTSGSITVGGASAGGTITIGSTSAGNTVIPHLGGTTRGLADFTNATEKPSAAATTDAGNIGYVGLQSGVPFILSSGCTTSATGALTACPTYPNATNPYTNFPLNVLMWFPAATVNTNAGQIGNAVGWYWVQLATSTTGQICTEGADAGGTHAGYQSGSPVVPGSCTHPTAAIACASGNACLNGNAQVVGPNFTLPGHSLGNNGRLEYEAAATTDGAAQVKTIKVRLNSAQIGGNAVPTTALSVPLVVHVQNAGTESSQATRTYFPTGATLTTLQQNGNIPRTVVDTTVSNPADIVMTVAAGGTDFVLESYSIKVFPN